MPLPGGKLLPGKTPVGKFSPKFRDSIFAAFLRIVEFYLHKDSNYRQNSLQKFPALRAGLYIFPLPAGRDRIFPGQNKDWDRIFPSRIPPGQNFSLIEFPPPTGNSLAHAEAHPTTVDHGLFHLISPTALLFFSPSRQCFKPLVAEPPSPLGFQIDLGFGAICPWGKTPPPNYIMRVFLE